MKEILFTNQEHHELVAIIRCVRYAARKHRNKPEELLAATLIRMLTEYNLGDGGVSVTLDRVSRLSLWAYVEKYIDYCSNARKNADYVRAVTIASKLAA